MLFNHYICFQFQCKSYTFRMKCNRTVRSNERKIETINHPVLNTNPNEWHHCTACWSVGGSSADHLVRNSGRRLMLQGNSPIRHCRHHSSVVRNSIMHRKASSSVLFRVNDDIRCNNTSAWVSSDSKQMYFSMNLKEFAFFAQRMDN